MIVIKKFSTIDEANSWMKGSINGGAPPSGNFVGLVGQTVTFTSPAGSCTFTQPTTTPTGMMKFADVKLQLETAISGLKVDCEGSKLTFYLSSGSAACSMGAVAEGGRAPLGLPNNQAVAGVLMGVPGGAAPALVSIVPEAGAVHVIYNK
jgi:hypothetical protein